MGNLVSRPFSSVNFFNTAFLGQWIFNVFTCYNKTPTLTSESYECTASTSPRTIILILEDPCLVSNFAFELPDEAEIGTESSESLDLTVDFIDYKPCDQYI